MSNPKPDALTGEPLSAEEEAFYAAMAEDAEADDYGPEPGSTGLALEGDEAAAAARAELDAIIGADELDAATRRGRPSLSKAGGASPRFQVRLAADQGEALARRAAGEARKPAELLRDGATVYLRLAADDGAGQIVAAALEEYAARLEQEAAQPGSDAAAPGVRSRAALARSVRSDLAQLIHH